MKSLFLLVVTSILLHHAVGEVCRVDGQLRLTHTQSISTTNAGRVEICMGGEWGTISGNSSTTPWSEKNAQVACIELGFSGALNSILQYTIPVTEMAASTVPAHLNSVQCNGTEQNITDCNHSVSTQYFVHEEDVYIVCRPRDMRYSDVHPKGVQQGDIRLFGDTRSGYGAVQIYTTTHGWTGICPDSTWTSGYPSAICRDLGYSHGVVAEPVLTNSGPGGQNLSRLIYEMSCSFFSDSLEECSYMLNDDNLAVCSSPDGLFAAVECYHTDANFVRLIGGSDSRDGVVEIAYDGRWGMVCDYRFSLFDAQTVCEELGYDRKDAEVVSLSRSSSILRHESNLKPIWLTGLMCTSQNQLQLCAQQTHSLIGYANCTEFDIAAVDCGDIEEPRNIFRQYSGPIITAAMIVFGIPLGIIITCIFNKDKCWEKTKDCCGCFCGLLALPFSSCKCRRRRRRRGWSRNMDIRITSPPSTACTSFPEPTEEDTEQLEFDCSAFCTEILDSETAENTTEFNFDLKLISSELEGKEQSTDLEREQKTGTSDDQSNSRLTELPPPSFQDSFAFPTKVPSQDELPPPYAGSKEEPPLPPHPLDEATHPQLEAQVSISPDCLPQH